METVLRKITPLKLINPDDESFKAGSCKTFHDITRFAHQKAMQEMFRISDEPPEGAETIRLSAGMPLGVLVIDLGGGLADVEKLNIGAVQSMPFKAFLNGMLAVPWPEPRHVDVKGFFGMMAHTASLPEAELQEMGEQSFCFVSGEYMNFSIRLGYHLSVVEAFLGENINDNYIRFFFKGGGADLDRRLRRVGLISNVLKKLDFNVKVVEDIVDAVVSNYKKTQLEEKLEVLGKVTVYTKQMDAIMTDDASAEKYLEDFMETAWKDPG
jgi:pyruvate,water dikinase